MGNKLIDGIALTIAIIGAVNWGLIGFFDFNLVAAIFRQHDMALQNHLCACRCMWSLSGMFLHAAW